MNNQTQTKRIDRIAVNTIRFLAVDAVQKANSGHPGLPMGLADIAYILWTRFLKFNPDDPNWMNRDRFILSAGHGSALLYVLLHLSGYDVTLHDLKEFRQWGSRTPGHPEKGCLPGVETTTGPLGQGFANGVGMALAANFFAQKFNRNDFSPVDHTVFALVSDGDIMEGVSYEAASLAGHLQLGNLVYIFDDNGISIEGSTELTFSEDVSKRFESSGWHTLRIDGHDHRQIENAIQKALLEKNKPSLILAKTHIGYGSPGKQDSASSHGSPLGEEEVQKTKNNLNWPLNPAFYVPEEVREYFNNRIQSLKKIYQQWQSDFTLWKKSHPELFQEWEQMLSKSIPETFRMRLIESVQEKDSATRSSGGKMLQRTAELLPGFIGGSADLAPSTKTIIEGEPSIGPNHFSGRNIHFGIREHSMGSICNGMALYGGLIPYASTFLIFSDYMRPAIRLSALMDIQVIYIFTHDSIFVGEDGPTHQPVEQLASLRAIPNITIFRPADGLETALAYDYAVQKKDGPTILCLTRQIVPNLKRDSEFDPVFIQKGGYVLSDVSETEPQIILAASGSEVHMAIEVQAMLREKHIQARVLSVPSLDLFKKQSLSYQKSVIPGNMPLVIIEAAIIQGWHEVTRAPVLPVGMEGFGASAPYNVLAEKFGFTAKTVTEKVVKWFEEEIPSK